MCNKGHKYRKLNDHQLFCARCGETRQVNGNWSWTWKPYWQPYPYWTVTSPTYVTWNDTGSSTYSAVDSHISNTVWLNEGDTMVQKDAKTPVPGPADKKTIKGTIEPETKK